MIWGQMQYKYHRLIQYPRGDDIYSELNRKQLGKAMKFAKCKK